MIGLLVALIALTATLARQRIDADVAPEETQSAGSYSGVARPRDVSTVALPTAVVVRAVLVEVGDRVKAAQPLLMLDDGELRRRVDRLRLDIAQARTRAAELERTIELLDRSINALTVPAAEANARLALAQRTAETISNPPAKNSLERAQASYDEAAARERRLAAVAATSVVARQELEEAQIAVRAAAGDLAAARRSTEAAAALAAAQSLQAETQVQLTIAEQQHQRQQRAGELTETQLHQREAERALEIAARRLADLAVRAPGDALVAEVPAKPGDRVAAGAALVKLATVNPMVVNIDVPLSIVDGLARGNAATVRVGAASTEYSGRIKTIAPLPGESGAHTVAIEFDNPAAALLAGRTAHVRLTPHVNP